MEFMEGIPIDNFSVDIGNNQNKEYNENIQDNSTESTFNQEDRNWIGNQLLKLCFIELFSLGFVQTDPNPANFFYNKEKNQLILLDLGAGRTYDDQFLDSYKQIIIGASNKNNELIMDYSIKMGFLTGEENRKMLKAHLNCILALGEAFVGDIYNYGTQKSTQKVSIYIYMYFNNIIKYILYLHPQIKFLPIRRLLPHFIDPPIILTNNKSIKWIANLLLI